MKNQYAKIFKKISENGIEIVKFDYSPSQDEYYSFIKKHFDDGFRQVIITSEIMIEIAKDYFLYRSFKISNIEFMIEDRHLADEIRIILDKLSTDRAYLAQLTDRLRFLIEESSIDIKKIELKGKTETNTAVSLGIQVNGVFGITDSCFEMEGLKLVEKIAGYIQT